MATKPRKILTKEIREVLTCSICKETLKTRYLPCNHCFCEACIDQHFSTTSEENSALCPLCRRPFILDLERAKGLPKILEIENIRESLEKYYAFYTKTKDDAQDNCELCSKGTNTLNICIDCGKNMCHKCTSIHDKLFRNCPHRVKTTAEIDDVMRTLMMKKENMGCDCIKGSKKFTHYCHDCGFVMCQQCNMNKHEGHNVKDITSVAKAGREVLKLLLDDMDKELNQMNSSIENIEIEHQRFISSQQDLEQEVGQLALRLHDAIEKQKNEILQEQKARAQEIEAAIASRCNTINEQKQSKEKLAVYIRCLQEYGNEGIIASEATRLCTNWHNRERFQVPDKFHYNGNLTLKRNTKYIEMLRYNSFGFIESQTEKSEKVERERRASEEGPETTSIENNDHYYSSVKTGVIEVNGQEHGQEQSNRTPSVANVYMNTHTAVIGEERVVSPDVRQTISTKFVSPLDRRTSKDHPEIADSMTDGKEEVSGPGQKNESSSLANTACPLITKSTKINTPRKSYSNSHFSTKERDIELDGPDENSLVPERRDRSQSQSTSSAGFGEESMVSSDTLRPASTELHFPLTPRYPPIPQSSTRSWTNDLASSDTENKEWRTLFFTEDKDENRNAAHRDQVTTNMFVTNQDEIRDDTLVVTETSKNVAKGHAAKESATGKQATKKQQTKSKSEKTKSKTLVHVFSSLLSQKSNNICYLPNLFPVRSYKRRDT